MVNRFASKFIIKSSTQAALGDINNILVKSIESKEKGLAQIDDHKRVAVEKIDNVLNMTI